VSGRNVLPGTVAVVTGGGRGIGAGIARALASAGATVVVTTRTASELNRTADAVRATGGVALPVVADLTDPDSVDAMVAATLDEFGAIDVLVNAAGRMSPIGVPLWD
jgi:NAD(P)-dependent dehydrogenase (short-subunit alcohol dehydrogenase family)